MLDTTTHSQATIVTIFASLTIALIAAGSPAGAEDKTMNTEFFTAIRTGDGTKVRQLVAADPTLAGARTTEGVSAVLWAAYVNHPEIAEELANGRTLDIFEAAALGRTDRLEALLASTPSLAGAYSADGWTALHLAAFFGRDAAVRALLLAGARVDARSKNRENNYALNAAMVKSSTGSARLLIEAGADVNARAAGGFVAIHEAALNGNREMLALLLDAGADVNARSDDGKTAVGYALSKDHAAIAEMLRQRGGTP